MSSYQPGPDVMQVPAVAVNERATFIIRTYNHLFAAIVGFTLLEVFLFKSGIAERIVQFVAGMNWLIILGAFVLVSWLASRAAATSASKPVQYAALAGFVTAQAIIFVPLLYVAQVSAQGGVIESAAALTLLGFAGLTAIVFITRKDFSFLRGVVMWGGIVAMLLIVGAVLFGFQMGTWFSVAMVGLAGAAILYDTSSIIRRYPSDRYVAAALQLFASVALMFWYILRLFLSRD